MGSTVPFGLCRGPYKRGLYESYLWSIVLLSATYGMMKEGRQ